MSGNPDIRPSSVSTAGYEDGLGRRSVRFNREVGGMLECLELRPQFLAFEPALRQRAEELARLDDERFARVRGFENTGGGLVVVSELVTGHRLIDILETRQAEDAPVSGIDAAFGFLLQGMPALAELHASSITHGAVAPGRILVTPNSQVVLLDCIYGSAVERLNLSRSRLWSTFGIVAPSFAGAKPVDPGTDVAQMALCGLLLAAGRPPQAVAHIAALAPLVREVVELAEIRAGARFAEGVGKFFAMTLPAEGKQVSIGSEVAAGEIRALIGYINEDESLNALAEMVSSGLAPKPAAERGSATAAQRSREVVDVLEASETDEVGDFEEEEIEEAVAAPAMIVAAERPGASAGPVPPAPASPPPVAPTAPPVRLRLVEPADAPVHAPAEAPATMVQAMPAPVIPVTAPPAVVAPPPVAAVVQPLPPAVVAAAAPPPAPAPPPIPVRAEPPRMPVFHAPPLPPQFVPGPGVVFTPPAAAPLPPPTVASAPPAAAAIGIRKESGSGGPAPIGIRQQPPSGFAPARHPGSIAPLPPRQERGPDGPFSGSNSGRRGFSWKLAGAAALLISLGLFGAHAYRQGEADSIAPAAEPRQGAAPTAAKDVPRHGSLAIDSQPSGARVTMDGKEIGVTPLVLDAIPVGRHQLSITSGTATVQRIVQVEPGRQASVSVPVFSGFLAVFAPIRLDISEGRRSLGSTETGRILLPPGRHVLTLTNSDLGFSVSQTVEIQPGQERVLNLKPTGRVNLNASPWAEVWVDGTRAGETPLANLEVPLGTREFVFKHPQYGERRLTATITTSASALSVDLSRPPSIP